MATPITIGELGKRTGISPRALRHYDEIGLLRPSGKTEAGYRLYEEKDIARLQQILSLQTLGFSLEDIADTLGRPDYSPRDTVREYLRAVRERIKSEREMEARLDGIERLLAANPSLTTEELLDVIASMERMHALFTPEERMTIEKQGERLGREGIVATEREWPALMAEAKRHMDEGTDPSDPVMQEVARRWKELVDRFTGGNQAIAAKMRKEYEKRPQNMMRMGGPDPALMAYVGRAMEAAGISL